MIDPVIADQELAANRPLPRGRAAWKALDGSPAAVSQPDTPRASPAAMITGTDIRWAATPAVLGALFEHAGRLLADRLRIDAVGPETIALMCAHLSEVLTAVTAMAYHGFDDPIGREIPHFVMPECPGIDGEAILRRVLYEDRYDVTERELDTFRPLLGSHR
jgi:hypothetical protein